MMQRPLRVQDVSPTAAAWLPYSWSGILSLWRDMGYRNRIQMLRPVKRGEDFQVGRERPSDDFEILGAASLRSLQGCGFFDPGAGSIPAPRILEACPNRFSGSNSYTQLGCRWI